ncbi:phosphatidylinositol N-acetylglucosaminyltransferase subunit Q-like [Gigantopelta aegis]|uniref:phosphatidylinositol N-acetylglucosaminyltransferase subunit Q-like n=1 Tax=Gigantopelta aegis TaxID=1735272 RepID=UPI001B88BA1B|nr:phosphatidylinositol N-acetylglucosaminyltransferase subunit Q-like [Gigantopelta aegis]XP_041362455.1 phosphatidylinositol N-acetylglucosaminyltransferase subunit Q-like [Gigantopelta aegis]
MSEIWKVFFPFQLKSAQHGYLVGSVCEETRHVYAHCVISNSKLKKSNKENKIVPGTSLFSQQIIGIWNSLASDHTIKSSCAHIPNYEGSYVWVIAQEQVSQCLSCDLFTCRKGASLKLKCHCILYNPIDVLSSYLICSKSKRFLECDQQNPVSEHGNETLLQNNFEIQHRSSHQVENVASLVAGLTSFEHSHTLELSNSDVVASWPRDTGYFLFYLSVWLNSVVQNLSGILPYVGGMFDNLCVKYPKINYLLDVPSLTRQLRLRYHQRKNVTAFLSHDNSVNKLLYADVCWQQLVDTVLGVLLMVFIMQAGMADNIAHIVMMWAEEVGRSLTNLINWLMGAPAGLKLNSQLTQFLGHFFLYHIYLWTGYLSILRPVLGSLLYYSSSLGLLGFSVQLCLIQDILSMLTLHIYCFYVYAARLYSLQVFTLASLWRLFRGKKWNVLRHRVDSASYDVDQLFVGTLFFTLMLFLLPTMLLYYIVFLVLRLGVLFVKGVLSTFVTIINATPAFTLILWIVRSKAVSGDVKFTVVPNSQTENTLILTMQTSHLSLTKLLKTTKISPPLELQQEKHSVATLLHNMVNGELIYPWIPISSFQKKEKTK